MSCCHFNQFGISEGLCAKASYLSKKGTQMTHFVHLLHILATHFYKVLLLFAKGMSLSGGDTPKSQEEIVAAIKTQYPGLAQTSFVCGDTRGSLATALPSGAFCELCFTLMKLLKTPF